jgi:hypothetical protein
MLFVHILLGGAFPKRYRANCGVIAVIRKVPILGRHMCSSYLPLGVPNWTVIYINTVPHQANFLASLPGKKKTSVRGVLHAHPLLCFSFALLYFCLHRFIKNTKNLVPSIVVILVGLLFSCFIMLSINGWFL